MKTVQMGIIGLGSQGQTYAQLIGEEEVPFANLRAVCTSSEEKGEAIRARFPQVTVYKTYEEMIRSGQVDAIITCAPHKINTQIAYESLRENVHVLLEKPAGISAEEVRYLTEYAATKPDLTFSMMFNQRTHPLYQKVRLLIQDGVIGEVRRMNWIVTNWWRPQAYYDSSSWRATWKGEGGGVLVNQAAHQLDLLQWLFGLPSTVFAKVNYGFKRTIAVEDDVTVLLDFDEGKTGVFTTCTHDIFGTDRLEILGDQGKLLIENGKTLTISTLPVSEQDISEKMSEENVREIVQGKKDLSTLYTTETQNFKSVWGEQHIRLITNFVQAIRGEEQLIAPGADGLNAVQLSNAIHLSSWLEQEVQIPVDEKLFNEQLAEQIVKELKEQ